MKYFVFLFLLILSVTLIVKSQTTTPGYIITGGIIQKDTVPVSFYYIIEPHKIILEHGYKVIEGEYYYDEQLGIWFGRDKYLDHNKKDVEREKIIFTRKA